MGLEILCVCFAISEMLYEVCRKGSYKPDCTRVCV